MYIFYFQHQNHVPMCKCVWRVLWCVRYAACEIKLILFVERGKPRGTKPRTIRAAPLTHRATVQNVRLWWCGWEGVAGIFNRTVKDGKKCYRWEIFASTCPFAVQYVAWHTNTHKHGVIIIIIIRAWAVGNECGMLYLNMMDLSVVKSTNWTDDDVHCVGYMSVLKLYIVFYGEYFVRIYLPHNVCKCLTI